MFKEDMKVRAGENKKDYARRTEACTLMLTPDYCHKQLKQNSVSFSALYRN